VQKISKFDILVQNSFKYLSKELQIIKELLDTLACNIVKLKSKAAPGLAISHTKFSEIAPRPMYQLLSYSLNNSSASLDTDF